MCALGSHHREQQQTRESKTGVMSSMASCLSGYSALHGLKSDFGMITTGSQSLMRPTSYLLTAHKVLGTSCRAVIASACFSDKQENVL